MKCKKAIGIILWPSLLLTLMGSVISCHFKEGVPRWSGSGFLRESFLDYRSVAVLPFEGDDSGEVTDAFIQRFRERFPQISVVGPKRVAQALQGQRLNPEQLDETTRIKVGRTVGVPALVTGSIYYPSIFRWLLQVVIADTETGKVMGRSLVEIDYMGAMGAKEGARLAVEKLTLR